PPPSTVTARALGGLETAVFCTLRLVKPLVPLNWLAPGPVPMTPVLWSSKVLTKAAPSGEPVVPETGVLVVVGVVAVRASVAVATDVLVAGASVAVATDVL